MLAIVDYKAGNLTSVQNAFAAQGGVTTVTRSGVNRTSSRASARRCAGSSTGGR